MEETCSSKETSAKGRKEHQWVVAQELDDFFQSPDKENHFYLLTIAGGNVFAWGNSILQFLKIKIEFWR